MSNYYAIVSALIFALVAIAHLVRSPSKPWRQTYLKIMSASDLTPAEVKTAPIAIPCS